MEAQVSDSCSMAITYVAKEYDTQREQLMGRHSASEAFLKAWSQSEEHSPLYSFSRRTQDHQHFTQKTSPWRKNPIECVGLYHSRELIQHQCDAIYTPDPNLAKGAWHRTATGSSAYSMVGVTHTLSSDGAMDLIGELATSPTEPWDALICTSESVKSVVEKLITRKLEYLRRNFDLKTPLKPSLPQLPVIPLGVDIDRYPSPKSKEGTGKLWRKKLDIPQDAIVSLFVGRLSFHAKAHPFAMFESLERCAAQSEQHLTLVLCGWFANDATKDCFVEAANLICPSIQLVIVDGRDPDTQNNIWSVADLFISLSDNIQETFGLTPLEAMANGLPVVVSDWDGYRESVRHGVDGFRARTVSPPIGSGEGLARLHDEGSLSYDAFLMETCQQVVVDIDEVTGHIHQLISHPELRKEMGENGRRRVIENYTWSSIALRYRVLLSQLKERREKDSNQAPRPIQNPLRPDPFDLHSHYATSLVGGTTLIQPGVTRIKPELTLSLKACKPLRPLTPKLVDSILRVTQEKKSLKLSELQTLLGKDTKDLIRHLLILGKYGYLRLDSQQA